MTAAALVTALAACGNDDLVTPAAGATTPASAAPALPPLRAADYVLVGGPVTATYTAEQDTDTSETSVFDAPLPSCMHLTAAELGPPSTDHANGQIFDDDESGTEIQSDARVFASADTVLAHRAITQRPEFPACAGQAILGGMSERDRAHTNLTVKSAAAQAPPTGATAFTRLDLAGSIDGQDVDLHADVISLFSGRVESVIVVVSPDAPLPMSRLDALTSQVAATLVKQ
jgi:hypothetical protein